MKKPSRVPVQGELLEGVNGTRYVVGPVVMSDDDPAFYRVDMVPLELVDELTRLGYDLDPQDFAAFCRADGIELAPVSVMAVT